MKWKIPEAWEPGESIYTHKLTARSCVRIMENSSPEGSLPPWAIEVQAGFIHRFREARSEHSLFLDLGCGIGNHARALSRKGFKIRGYDISPPAIKKAKRRSPDSEFYWYDLREAGEPPYHFPETETDSLDGAYLVYGTWCTLEPEQRARLLQRVHNALIPGGLFFFDGFFAFEPNPVGISRDPAIPICLWEDSYISDPGGFWGLLPKRIQEFEWYFPNHTLFAEEYRVKGNRFLTWKQSVHPGSYGINPPPGFSLVTISAGSFGVHLPPEIQIPSEDPFGQLTATAYQPRDRKENDLKELGLKDWEPREPWFTVVLQKTGDS